MKFRPFFLKYEIKYRTKICDFTVPATILLSQLADALFLSFLSFSLQEKKKRRWTVSTLSLSSQRWWFLLFLSVKMLSALQ